MDQISCECREMSQTLRASVQQSHEPVAMLDACSLELRAAGAVKLDIQWHTYIRTRTGQLAIASGKAANMHAAFVLLVCALMLCATVPGTVHLVQTQTPLQWSMWLHAEHLAIQLNIGCQHIKVRAMTDSNANRH